MSAVDIAERRKRPEGETLWKALAAAQAEFGPLVKDTQGARGKYAPLDQVLDVLRPVLNRHGLILSQPTSVESDMLIVRTMIVHKDSGETHECVYPAGLLTLQHQLLGAGVSYARRYSLLSLLGVFPANEDDDGEKAGAAGGRQNPTPPPRAPAPSIRSAAQPFIAKAVGEIKAAEHDLDAAYAALDAIKERPGWQQLNDAERRAVMDALPEPPDDR